MQILLFKNDWAYYPSAVVDYNTTNTSFLKLVKVYKQMGIKNCEFPLVLLQPELSGIDPFDETLSAEYKMKIAMECKYNPWYFFREVARLPPNAGSKPIRFKANRGNIALFWSFFNHVDFCLLQPRQTGKSASTDSLMNGLLHIWATNTDISLITKDMRLRNANVERLKRMRDLLPEYIHPRNPLDADNQELLTCVRLGNNYKTAVGRNDKMAADKLGRGMTVPIMHFDEVPYINLIGVSLPVALSSSTAARQDAIDAGQPYGNIFTTTPGSTTTRDGKYAHDFMTGGAPWTEHYFDLENEEQLAAVVEKNSTGLKPMIYAPFNHRQLGRSDEWLYETLRQTATSGELADRDYFNLWTASGEGSPLTKEDKEALQRSEEDAPYVEITNQGYALRWYVPRDQIEIRMSQGRYVLGIDPSETLGGNNDATGFVVIDVETHDLICAGRFNETNTPNLASFIADFLIRYLNVTLIIERKSMGIAILELLFVHLTRAGVDPFKRIYNRIVDEQDEYRSEYKEIQIPVMQRPVNFYDRFKRYFGFNTSGSGKHARDALFGEALHSAMRYGSRRAKDKFLISELLGLIIRNDRIDHQSDGHDDMVVSFLLCHWMCIWGRNLNYYNINANTIFSRALLREEAMSTVELYRAQQQAEKREQFNMLLENLKASTDQMEVARLEMQLRRLSKEVDLGEQAGVGIDAMLRQAHEERQRKHKMHRFSNRRLMGGGFGRAA